MWGRIGIFLVVVSALSAQTIRNIPLDAQQVVDLPVSREITTVMFPGPLTAVAGADMLIDNGREASEVEEGTPVRFHISHASGSNFILVQSVQPDATGRLTAIFDGAAYVIQLRTVANDSVASVIFGKAAAPVATRVEDTEDLPQPREALRSLVRRRRR